MKSTRFQVLGVILGTITALTLSNILLIPIGLVAGLILDALNRPKSHIQH